MTSTMNRYISLSLSLYSSLYSSLIRLAAAAASRIDCRETPDTHTHTNEADR